MEAFETSSRREGRALVPIFRAIADVDFLPFEDGARWVEVNRECDRVVQNFCVDFFVVVEGVVGVAAVARVGVAGVNAEPPRRRNAARFGL